MELPKKDKFNIDLTTIHEKSKEEQLTYVFSAFKENCLHYRCSSAKIFQDVYADSTGAMYWLGWCDKEYLTVPFFVSLMATHKTVEYIDSHLNNAPDSGKILSDVSKKIRSRLFSAAKKKPEIFEGDLDCLTSERAYNKALLGFGEKSEQKMRPNHRNHYSPYNTKIYPLEALKWFDEIQGRWDLLPESLLNWRNSQSMKKNESGQEIESPKKHKQQKPEEEAIVKLVWREVTSLYQKIKEVGFGGLDIESKLKDQAKNELKTNHSNYRYIKSRHLNSKKLFNLAPGQEKRDFIGQLLQIIAKDNNIKRTNYQRLYKIGVKTFLNHN